MVADAENGEAALEMLRTERFDLILLDINMPGISGLETCRAIRARSDMSILMLSVRDRAGDKIEALDAGADGYVTKPFDVNELLARIRATLRRAPVVSAGGITGASARRYRNQLSRSPGKVKGHVTRLTPKELDLLHYFVSHPNVVLPHDKILQAVWGPDYG